MLGHEAACSWCWAICSGWRQRGPLLSPSRSDLATRATLPEAHAWNTRKGFSDLMASMGYSRGVGGALQVGAATA